MVGGRDIGRRFGGRESVELGFQDVMQKNFGDVLTSDQINDLIAYLMTEK